MSDFDIQIQARAVGKLELVTHDVTIQSECEILHKCGTVLTPLLKRAFKFRQKDHEFVWRASTVVSEIHRAWKYMKNIFDLNAKLDALHEAAIEVHLQVLKDEERGRLLPAGLFRHEPSMDPIAVLEGDVMTIVKNAPILDLNTEYILQMKEMKDVIEARKKDEEKNAEVMQILEEHKQRLDEEERALEERRKRIDQEFEDRQKQINAKYEEDRQDLDRRMAEMQKKSDDEAEAARKKQEMRRLQELKDKALAERLARKEAENADLKELQANFKKLELERKEIERQTKKDVERRKAEHEAFEEKYRRDRARHREELLSGWKQDFPRQDMRKNENVKVSSSVKIEGGAYNRRQPRRQRSKSVDGFEWEQVHPADSHRKRSKNPFVDFSIDTSIHEAPEDYYMQPRPFRHSMSRQQFLPPDFYASLPHRSSHNVATTIISNSFNTDTVFADNHYVSRPRRGGRYYDY